MTALFPDPNLIPVARQIAQLAKGFGCSNAVIVGMFVTQAHAESTFDPNALGDYVLHGKQLPWMPHYPAEAYPTAFSLYQLHPNRTALVKAEPSLGFDLAAGAVAKTNTIVQCVQAAWWELKTFAYFNWDQISKATTAYEAAAMSCQFFERAASPIAEQARGQLAERWAVHGALLGL